MQIIINNGFAKTEIDQVFFNRGDTDREAVYSFPVPRRASLSELSLWIDGREIVGEVLEKERARKVYEDQKTKGGDSALAEKEDYRTFDVSVSPVRAKAETRVRLVYYQPLEIDLNIGRYVYPLEEGNVDDGRIAFWSVDARVQSSFSFNLELKSAFPVKEIRVPGFQNQAVITRSDNSDTGNVNGEHHRVALIFQEGSELSRDIVVYYRLDDGVPARIELIPYRDGGQHTGTFMVVVTPGGSIQPIAEGTDWTFVLDVSGSMGGRKIATLVDGVNKVLGRMSSLHGERVRNLTSSQVGNLYVGQQLVLFGQYMEAGDVEIEFSGRMAGEAKRWRTRAYLPETATDNPEIERLWALAAIEETMEVIRDKGETGARRNKIVELGTEYSLVTDYTSMVVLDEAEMEGLGMDRRNARRVEKERKAQEQRALKPVKNYRVDRKPVGGGMFGNASSPGIGTGPVGPLFIGLACWLRRKKRAV